MPPDDIITELQTGEKEQPDLEALLEKANDDANVFYE